MLAVSPGPDRDFGRYRIVSELGHGAMGTVYRAHDSVLRRGVALKLLRTASDDGGAPPSQESVARLLREARAAAAINHPNAVSIFDIGEVEGTPYIAMELVEGQGLRACIGVPSLPIATRLGWLVDIARALAAAHERGVIHRDVKPENIIVRHDGVLKVLDFGIAKQVGGAGGPPDTLDKVFETRPGMVVGTPAYMAPEQLCGEAADAGSDQFAWGVVAYELLGGARPWGAEDQGLRALSEMAWRDPLHLSAQNPAITVPLGDVVMRAISRDRRGRFGSMNELLAAVGAAPAQPVAAATGRGVEMARARAQAPTEVSTGAGELVRAAELAATEGATVPPAAGRRRRPPTVAVVVGAAAVLAAVIGARTVRRASPPVVRAAAAVDNPPAAEPRAQRPQDPAPTPAPPPPSAAAAPARSRMPEAPRPTGAVVHYRPARGAKAAPQTDARPQPAPTPPAATPPETAPQAPAAPARLPARPAVSPYEDPH
jgi:serine/threonine-protein kinase